MNSMKYDVVVIGGGVIGCAVARELSRYQLKTCVVEREEDVCSGTSKANSAIVHGGFDAEPGSLKAKFNIQGSRMMEELSEELDFEYKRNGSLVLCFAEEDKPALQALYEKGMQNGVEGMSVISGDEARKMEPNIEDTVVAALNVPSGGIVCPFGLTIALAENACDNGVEFCFLTEVEHIEKTAEEYSQTAWHTLEGIKAKAIAGGERERMLILDENNTLWNCSKEDTNDRLEVAQNVTSFCYSAYNKMRYHDDIWYRTADGGLYHHHYGWGDPIGTPDTPEEQLPATDQYDLPGVPVATEDGNVLLQQEDGTYLFLQANSEVPKVYTMPLKGVYAEGNDFRYMVAGTDGRLYYHSDADTDPRNPIDEVNWVVELPN